MPGTAPNKANAFFEPKSRRIRRLPCNTRCGGTPCTLLWSDALKKNEAEQDHTHLPPTQQQLTVERYVGLLQPLEVPGPHRVAPKVLAPHPVNKDVQRRGAGALRAHPRRGAGERGVGGAVAVQARRELAVHENRCVIVDSSSQVQQRALRRGAGGHARAIQDEAVPLTVLLHRAGQCGAHGAPRQPRRRVQHPCQEGERQRAVGADFGARRGRGQVRPQIGSDLPPDGLHPGQQAARSEH